MRRVCAGNPAASIRVHPAFIQFRRGKLRLNPLRFFAQKAGNYFPR
jgi:hypothetical protein